MTSSLEAFVAPFAAPVREAVAAAERHGAVVVLPAAEIREFRRQPSAALSHVSSALSALWKGEGPSTVIWCQAGDHSSGLDDFELTAALGRILHLDVVAQATIGEDKRLVAIGSLRHEVIGIAFRIPAASSLADMTMLIAALAAGELSVADFAVASTFVYRKGSNISLETVPHVSGWIDRLEARPSWQAAVAPVLELLKN